MVKEEIKRFTQRLLPQLYLRWIVIPIAHQGPELLLGLIAKQIVKSPAQILERKVGIFQTV